jgi:glycosyltransferase involved in cell wall biosynthesis
MRCVSPGCVPVGRAVARAIWRRLAPVTRGTRAISPFLSMPDLDRRPRPAAVRFHIAVAGGFHHTPICGRGIAKRRNFRIRCVSARPLKAGWGNGSNVSASNTAPRGPGDSRPPSTARASTVGPHLHLVLLDFRDLTHPEAGGAEVFLNEIFQRIAARGHKVTLLCSRHGQAPREQYIGAVRVLRVGPEALINFAAARTALRLAREEHVDLFVENLCKLPFLMPILTSIPVLPVLHHLFGHTVFYELNPVAATYVWCFEKLLPTCYRGLCFVTVSESSAADLRQRGVAASRVDIVHNGVALRRFRGSAGPGGEPLLVYVGRHKRYKQLDIVIRAFALVQKARPEARLVFVGKGDDLPRLQTLVRGLKLTAAVTFTGFVPEEEKIDWLRRARAAVYPSTREGWGIAAVEAAACGTPVIASNVDGLRDAVRDGVTGFLVPHRDIESWARRMIEVLNNDDLRERLSVASLEWAANFDWDAEAERMHAIIREVAGIKEEDEQGAGHHSAL